MSFNYRKKLPFLRCNFLCLVYAYVFAFCTSLLIILFALWRLQFEDDVLPSSLPVQLYAKLSEDDRSRLGEFGWPDKDITTEMSCSLSEEALVTYETSGWTKSIYKVAHGKTKMAMKKVNPNGEDVRLCSRNSSVQECYEKALAKLLKELILHQELKHPNIVQLLDWCVSQNEITLFTEYCDSFSTIPFLKMPFLSRLKVSLDMANLLKYFATSLLGPLTMMDFRKEQFLLCNATLKLTDLDDLVFYEPSCKVQSNCNFGTCQNGLCMNHNELFNVHRMVDEIVKLTLGYDTPDFVRLPLEALIKQAGELKASDAFGELEQILGLFCSRSDCR